MKFVVDNKPVPDGQPGHLTECSTWTTSKALSYQSLVPMRTDFLEYSELDSLGLLGTENPAKLGLDSWTLDLQKAQSSVFDIHDLLSYPLIAKVACFPLILLAKIL